MSSDDEKKQEIEKFLTEVEKNYKAKPKDKVPLKGKCSLLVSKTKYRTKKAGLGLERVKAKALEEKLVEQLIESDNQKKPREEILAFLS
jgi:hypothetical protein